MFEVQLGVRSFFFYSPFSWSVFRWCSDLLFIVWFLEVIQRRVVVHLFFSCFFMYGGLARIVLFFDVLYRAL